MKKLLLIVLAAGSFVALSEARRGCCKKEVQQDNCCPKPEKACCIREPRIVCQTSSCDRGCMPDMCGVVPAPIDVQKNTHVIETFSCVPNPCAAPATEDQLKFFKEIGAVREGTTCQ